MEWKLARWIRSRLYSIALTGVSVAALIILLETRHVAHSAPSFPCTGCIQAGHWDQPFAWGGTAIHMALSRGLPQTGSVVGDSVYVLFWAHDESTWVWRPDTLEALTSSSKISRHPSNDSNIFCAGHTFMSEGGRLLIIGGTDHSPGLEQTNIFQPRNPSSFWLDPRPPDMRYGRWYASGTLLHDGRILATTGAYASQARAFGGYNGSGVTDDVHGTLAMDSTLSVANMFIQDTDPPLDPRQGHSAIQWASFMIVYGGTDADSDTLGDVWRFSYTHSDEWGDWPSAAYPTTADADYGKPKGRSRHTAIYDPGDTQDKHDDAMVIFGGLTKDSGADTPLNDVWKLYLTGESTHENFRKWEKLEPSGTAPDPVYGHCAVYDPASESMLVFGGTDGSSWSNEVWRLTLGDTPAWSAVSTSSDKRPTPREGHSGVLDANHSPDRLVIFGGGRDEAGTSSDSLFADLWTLDLSNGQWRLVEPADDYPDPRRHHSAVVDPAWNRMVLYAGDTTIDPSDGLKSDVWELSLYFSTNGPATWAERHASLGSTGRALHAAVYDRRWTYVRVPEIFTPSGSSGTWDTLGTARKWQQLYPYMFQIPSGSESYSGKVFFAGPVDTTWHLDVSGGGSWSTLGGPSGFSGGSAVAYRPGKIMKCGGDEDVEDVTATKRIELTGSSPSWVASFPPMDSSRVSHNLTLLPNGKVLMTGGSQDFQKASTAVVLPRIWDPGTGEWSFSPTLAPEPARRDYHSGALLLADARILSAGGYDPLYSDKFLATIYYPPYLFDSNGNWAARPQISGRPDTIGYGRKISICSPQYQGISSVALLRPGAVTHGFNESQLYIPLTTISSSGDHLIVDSPVDGYTAPPGDYMLFVVNSNGVPSIAKWVTVSGVGGLDTCDEVAPASLLPSPELISQTQIYFEWTATADDASLAASGRAAHHDFRRSADPIQTESAWSTAILLPEPFPAAPGTLQDTTVAGLQSCTTYYFALRADDDNANLSALHDTVKAKTLCTGGGGGDPNSALGEVVNAETGETVSTARSEARRSPLSTQSANAGVAAALTVESEAIGSGAWRFTIQSLGSLEDGDASKVLRQTKDASGLWQTQSSVQPAVEEFRLGICATGRPGRKVFPGAWELTEIASTIFSPMGDLMLVSAEHSTLSGLDGQVWAGDGSVSLVPEERTVPPFPGAVGVSLLC